MTAANVFAAFMPTLRHPGIPAKCLELTGGRESTWKLPGPRVNAIPSISFARSSPDSLRTRRTANGYHVA